MPRRRQDNDNDQKRERLPRSVDDQPNVPVQPPRSPDDIPNPPASSAAGKRRQEGTS